MRVQPTTWRRNVALLLIGALLLTACGTGSTGGANTPTTVRTGYIPLMIYAPLYVGIERGFFAEEGLQVELTQIASGNDALVQLAAGTFDVALGGAGAGLFNAAQRGVKFSLVAPLHSEQPPVTTPLVISAKRSGEITSVADLKGMRVAVNAKGTATEYWLQQALATGGLTIADVDLQGVPFADVPAALESGSLDAAILAEPGMTINKQKGVISVLSDDFISGFAPTYLYMGDALLSVQPEVGKAFMRAYLRACRELQGPWSDEVAQIVEKYTKVPAAVVKQANRPLYDPNGRISLDNLNTLQAFFLERGELTYNEQLDIKAFVNTSLADEAAKALDAK
ncbi:MAG: ABC transporter substrate-binding protein [Chloroflexales bacterium]|nr:ABC transporter substrate-binding protein [Chloroflexales bacterium]